MFEITTDNICAVLLSNETSNAPFSTLTLVNLVKSSRSNVYIFHSGGDAGVRRGNRHFTTLRGLKIYGFITFLGCGFVLIIFTKTDRYPQLQRVTEDSTAR